MYTNRFNKKFYGKDPSVLKAERGMGKTANTVRDLFNPVGRAFAIVHKAGLRSRAEHAASIPSVLPPNASQEDRVDNFRARVSRANDELVESLIQVLGPGDVQDRKRRCLQEAPPSIVRRITATTMGNGNVILHPQLA